MAEIVSLACRDARLDVVPQVGGAIAAFRVGGFDVLRPMPAASIAYGDVRASACYPLVPYSNRIAQARLRVGAASFDLARNFGDHPHAIHGLGWQRPWRVIERDDRRLVLEFAHVPQGDGARAWPFVFRARQSMTLEADSDAAVLTVAMSIGSDDLRPFPFGLGFHPFFRRHEGTELAFAADGVWQTDATRLPTERTALPAAWQFATARAVDGLDIDNVFTGWSGSAWIGWPRHRRAALLEADRSMSHLVVYVPPKAEHLAVEPVTHMTDAFNRAAAGETGTGARTLGPGEWFSCTMRVTVADLAP
jgi:aldose 1-epimerase